MQRHIAESEKAMALFARLPGDIQYPADDMVKSFRSAIGDLLRVKRNALDEYNYAARQSARHGNAVYLSLLNHLNNSLLTSYAAFVQYSRPGYKLLAFPKAAPRFALKAPAPQKIETPRAVPFRDAPLLPFTVRPAAGPIAAPTLEALNQYVDFINESLRQINTWQALLRNYRSSADYFRPKPASGRRSGLSFAHDEVKLPHSFYGQVVSGSEAIPAPYRPSVLSQAEVLMNILKEMDALSIELVGYTREKGYEADGLKRSDEILARHTLLIGQFDARKEQLYHDIRRIYESYPPEKADNAWYVAGEALRHTLDLDKAVLFGVRDYLGGTQDELPNAAPLEAEGRKLIKDEYKNMHGLTRYGRSNGLCPYSYYEDIAENSIRLARKVKEPADRTNPYESFYYFYNNQLVYEYNRFAELAKPGLLKNIHQPNLFVLLPAAPDRTRLSAPAAAAGVRSTPPPTGLTYAGVSNGTPDPQPSAPEPPAPGEVVEIKRDTVFIERVDTVYIERGAEGTPVRSLEGYADNNLVLLLDVSASMNAPNKLPLLKQSVKSLLQLLRPTDLVTIVVYSGKAKVALEAASGAEITQIEKAIDALHSDGGTDGNDGIRLAYKMANRHYLRGGNNRIVLASDGEFPVGREVHEIVEANAREDVFLTVFHFTPHVPKAGNALQQLSEKGRGSYARITPENADQRLLGEMQGKKK